MIVKTIFYYAFNGANDLDLHPNLKCVTVEG